MSQAHPTRLVHPAAGASQTFSRLERLAWHRCSARIARRGLDVNTSGVLLCSKTYLGACGRLGCFWFFGVVLGNSVLGNMGSGGLTEGFYQSCIFKIGRVPSKLALKISCSVFNNLVRRTCTVNTCQGRIGCGPHLFRAALV